VVLRPRDTRCRAGGVGPELTNGLRFCPGVYLSPRAGRPVPIESTAGSFGPSARKLDHLGPFLSIFDDELAELGRRRRRGRAAEVGKARLQVRVREHSVECRVELIDDFGRRAPWRDDTIPQAGLESLDGFPNRDG
jgi:hypothetical protein